MMKTITGPRWLALFTIVLIIVACFCLTATARADSFGRARPGIFASSNALYGFKALPKQSTGILFTIDEDGKEQVIWRKRLVNIPGRVLVAPNGKSVVTIDTHADLGREHSLVVYDDKGTVIGDYRLEELLSDQEIRDHVVQTSPNRWWTNEASFTFRHEGRQLSKYFDVTLNWGKVVTVELDSGKLQGPRNKRSTGAAVDSSQTSP